jgi:VIT1/CCC1 family predicted Fe2+/Mn2+ transporter
MADTSPAESSEADVKRYRSNYQDEVDGAALYRYLGEAASEPAMKSLFERMAQSEEGHLALWAAKITEAGGVVPPRKPSFRVRVLGWISRRFGVGVVVPIVVRMEADATTMYDDQPEAVEHGLPADERSHARLFREIGRTRLPGDIPDIARIEGRHRGGTGNALRAAVLGVNDGLASNLSLVMGVAGANPGNSVVLVTGIAGLLAGSFSMAMGEWASVRTSAEAFARQLAVEREELELVPEEEEAELALIYEAKGLSPEAARETAHRIISNPQIALDTLAREELGMSAESVGNAHVAAITSFALFAGGAFLPLLPWFFTGGGLGIVLSVTFAGAGLFGVGAVTSLFSGRNVIFLGSRNLLMGLAVAAVTYGIGYLVGSAAGI